jgi:hypothetical protein
MISFDRKESKNSWRKSVTGSLGPFGSMASHLTTRISFALAAVKD